MIKKTVLWNRPDPTITWPWIGLAENDAHENWITKESTSVLDRSAKDSDHIYELTVYFETQEECDIHENSAELLALLNKMQSDMDSLGITRTVTTETV